MHTIAIRAWTVWLLIVALLGGIGCYVYAYIQEGQQWVGHSASPHAYTGGGRTIALGRVVDRDGQFLMELDQGRSYCVHALLRQSMLHWLGDRSGNIRPTVLQHYASQMIGFDRVNGIYRFGGGGATAVLTLSSSVQVAAMEALGNYKGTIAVYNYRTGEILCAVSSPSFDVDAIPNLESEYYEGVYLNRFTQASYVPGSIFKIVTTAAALEHLENASSISYTCTGSHYFGSDRVTCERAHGKQTLMTAFGNSCNCYYARLSQLLGAEELDAYVRRCGVLDTVSFDGVRTVTGNFEVSHAAAVEVAWSAIGQHKDLVNPCGFLAYLGSVAAGGMGAAPYVVAGVKDGDSWTYMAQTQTRKPTMSADTAAKLREYMRNNVQQFYGPEHFPTGMSVCAKSGTGEVSGQKRSYAMFAGFVEEDAYPLAFLVAVEDAGYGAKVCIPMIAYVLSACKEALQGA